MLLKKKRWMKRAMRLGPWIETMQGSVVKYI